jgi:hypothetical protein
MRLEIAYLAAYLKVGVFSVVDVVTHPLVHVKRQLSGKGDAQGIEAIGCHEI